MRLAAVPPGRRGLLLVVGFLVLTGVASWLAWHSVIRGALLPTYWLSPALWLGFAPLLERAVRRPVLPTLLLTGAASVPVAAAPGLILGNPLVPTLWQSLCPVVLVISILIGYRRLCSPAGWAPVTPRAILGLTALAVPLSALCAVVGGYPGLVAFRPGFQLASAWWAWDGVWGLGVGLHALLLADHREREREPAWQLFAAPVFALVSALVLIETFAATTAQLTWIALLVGAVAGLTLLPRLVSVYCLITAGLLAVLNDTGAFGPVEPATLYAQVMLFLLLMHGSVLSLLLSVVIHDNRRLIHELEGERYATAVRAASYSMLFDAMTDGLIVGDDSGSVWLHNPAANKMLGIDLSVPQRQSWFTDLDLMDLDGEPAALGRLDAVQPDRPERSMVVTPTTTDHPGRVLDVLAMAIDLERGPAIAVFLRDVTAETQQMQEMSRFAETVAHDLRNPLGATRTLLALALDTAGSDPGRSRQAIQGASDGAEALARIIDGWLAHTVTRSGALNPVPLQVADEVATVIGSRVVVPADTVLDVEAPDWVQADPLLLRQLLANVISNSVKYARPGEPVHLTVRSRRPGNGLVEISIADRGIGLSGADAAWLLVDGTREPTHSELVEGTGFGLAMCRRMTERHGGTLTIEDNTDGGATVRFTLPAAER